ncbi:hypothetical protein R83H12_02863 [Fibrobacteria bacterium R8-3-H12]
MYIINMISRSAVLFAVLFFFFVSAFAAFSDYKNRDSERFLKKSVKPFHADQDVVVVIMRESIRRGGGYTYQYQRENPEPKLTDK